MVQAFLSRLSALPVVLLTGLVLFALAGPPHPAHAADETAAPAENAVSGYAPHTWGDPDAPVKIVEFSSYTCGHCAAFHQETLPILKEDYIDTGKVQLTLIDFPLDNLAGAVSLITHCAPDPMGRKLVDIFYGDQEAWMTRTPRESISGLARLAGMSQAEVDACLENEALYAAIMDRRAQAGEQWEITGTPTFIINDEKYTGHYRPEDMTAAIDAILERAGD